MKRFLSIIAAIGMSATASSAVVACGTTDNVSVQAGQSSVNGTSATVVVKNVMVNETIYNAPNNKDKLKDLFGVFNGYENVLTDISTSDQSIANIQEGNRYDFSVTYTVPVQNKNTQTGSYSFSLLNKDKSPNGSLCSIKWTQPAQTIPNTVLGTINYDNDKTFTISLTNLNSSEIDKKYVGIKNDGADLAIDSVSINDSKLTIVLVNKIEITPNNQIISINVNKSGWDNNAVNYTIAGTDIILGCVSTSDNKIFTIALQHNTSSTTITKDEVSVVNGSTKLNVVDAKIDNDNLVIILDKAVAPTSSDQTLVFNITAAGWATASSSYVIKGQDNDLATLTNLNTTLGDSNITATFNISPGKGDNAKINDEDVTKSIASVYLDYLGKTTLVASDQYSANIKDNKLVVTFKTAQTGVLTINFTGSDQVSAATLTARWTA